MLASVKKAATVLCLVVATIALTVASAGAQIGPSNPSGGTSLRLATEEGRTSLGTVGLVSRQLTLPAAWQALLGNFVASQVASSFTARPAEPRAYVVTRRQTLKR